MEFIQLAYFPKGGIPNEEGLCVGLNVRVPEHAVHQFGQRDDLYLFRGCNPHTQNHGIGWFCDGANKTSFRLHIKF